MPTKQFECAICGCAVAEADKGRFENICDCCESQYDEGERDV